MARYNDISVEFWEDLLEVPKDQKFAYIYLFSNPLCRPSGLYQLKMQTFVFYTGLTEAAFKPLISRFIEYDELTQEVWVRGKINHIRNLASNINLQRSIETDLRLLKSERIRGLFSLKYETFLKPLTSGLRQGQGQGQGQYGKEIPKRKTKPGNFTQTQIQNFEAIDEFVRSKTSEPEDFRQGNSETVGYLPGDENPA